MDTTTALRRLRGNVGLYRNLLERFATQFALAEQPLQEALDRQDWVSAHRWAHTLKGLAANIGADELQAAAQALELALHGNQPREAVALVAPVARALTFVLDAIARDRAKHRPAVYAAPSASPANGPLDVVALNSRITELARRLESSSSDAKELLEPIAQQLQGHAAHADFLQIAQLVNDYALDQAHATLQAWAAQWDTQWGAGG